MKLTMIDNLDDIQYDAAKCYVRSRQVGAIFDSAVILVY